MKKTLAVCFVTEDYYPSFIGGQGVWGYHLVKELTKQGVHVTVLAEHRPGREDIIRVPFCFGNQFLLALFEYVYVTVLLRSQYFDILHANQLTALFFLLFRPKNIGNIVVSVHNTWDQMGRFWPLIFLESYIFRHADGLLFHTESEREYATRRYDLVKNVCSVVPMGAPKVMVRFQKNRRRVPVVLYVGRLVRRKNVDTILRALEKIQKNVQGIIIGQGPDRERLEEMAPSNVKFLGFIEDTSPYFRAADVFVLPSVAEGGVALAAYEAASYGLPLLLSRDAADPNILEHGKNGYIVDPDNSKEFAQHIESAIKNSIAFGKVSLRKARRLTWAKTASGTIAFYNTFFRYSCTE